MLLDLNHINQFQKVMDASFFLPFYCRVFELSREHRFIPLIAPMIGMTDALASLVLSVGTVGEGVIKGFGNIVSGLVTCQSRYLKVGGLQWIGVGVIGSLSLPIIFFRTLRISWGMLVHPEITSRQQAENYFGNVNQVQLKASKSPKIDRTLIAQEI